MANELYGGSFQTLQITTGNVLTVNDPFLATGPGVINNGAKNPIGESAYITDGTTTGRRWKIRYVRMNATTLNPTPVIGPVYYLDGSMQSVSTLAADAAAGVNGIAGLLLNTGITNGNFCFILISGFVGAANVGSITVPASTAAGDLLIGASGQQTFAREASGGSRTNIEIGMAMTAISGGKADVLINIEN